MRKISTSIRCAAVAIAFGALGLAACGGKTPLSDDNRESAGNAGSIGSTGGTGAYGGSTAGTGGSTGGMGAHGDSTAGTGGSTGGMGAHGDSTAGTGGSTGGMGAHGGSTAGTGGSTGGMGAHGGSTAGTGGFGGVGGSQCILMTGISECDNCFSVICESECLVAQNDQALNDYLLCLDDCDGDELCAEACNVQYPTAAAAIEDFLLCMFSNCPQCDF